MLTFHLQYAKQYHCTRCKNELRKEIWIVNDTGTGQTRQIGDDFVAVGAKYCRDCADFLSAQTSD